MVVDSTTSSALALRLKSLGAQSDDLEILFQAVERCVSVAANDTVVREPGASREVSALLEGTSCAYKRQEDGERSILSFQHPGEFCDLQNYILPDLGQGIVIEALTDCTVAVITYQDLDGLLSRPTLAFALWRTSVLEVAIYRERLSIMGRRTALERVAHLFCEQLSRREAVGIYTSRLPFSQIDVADASGLSVSHVNRVIQTLRTLNVLSRRHAIDVVDRKQLEKIAGFDGRYLSST